jgi:hypothetical protein
MKIVHLKEGGLESISLLVLKSLLFAFFVMKILVYPLKDGSIKRHYERKHASQLSSIWDQLRRDKITQLRNCYSQC